MIVEKATSGRLINRFYEVRNINQNSDILIEKPLNGDYYIIGQLTNNIPMESYHFSNNIIKQKRKIFRKVANTSFRIVFYNKDVLTMDKGFYQFDYIDRLYNDLPSTITVTYDYKIRFLSGKISALNMLINNNYFPFGGNYKELTGYFKEYLELVIKDQIGSYLKDNTIEEISSNSMELSNSIVEKINIASNNNIIYQSGFEVINFSFSLNDSYIEREEKRMIKKNKFLKNQNV